ncbi:outer membrane lipoprotein-sorting protein [Orenia metallireducens]|uniref:Outer membrane lipoprotein-sorting protein n=1 Tax=Orenia metallireducens TaxID=1413210 RepID=A0A285G0D1_9FIRM|nr:outer membrane lipoprotein-sorting protein [Orenia metallireducens]PRX31738.1 outer membrane lipoprotein-sorting protein [Orenia metallireducens]SNY17042.1 outer membrane lipoprotein-sorting protein [Orenia metallireducens]
MKSINKRLILLLFLITLIFSANVIYAKEPKDIIKLALEKQNLYQDSYLLEMECIVSEGDKRDSSSLKVYIYNGGERQMVTFTAPERLTDNKFLAIGTNTWMYKKGLHRPIRVSGSQKLFGDAGIGETVGIDYYRDYQIKEFKQSEKDYIFELIAKDSKTAYQQVKLTISKDNYHIKQVILKAITGTLLKELTYSNYRKIGEHELADIAIKNLLQNQDRVTELRYIDIENKKLSAKAFQPLMMGKFNLLIRD